MQQNIILSFLGTGRYIKETDENVYDETIYHWENQQCSTPFVQQAIHSFFNHDVHFVAHTQTAKEKQGEKLAQLISYKGINIPNGDSELELWEMFKVIADTIPAQCNLIIDVTHGFRHQPMLALAIAVYLRTVKDVKIDKILYGAYEARNKDTNVTPVYDLTHFLDIIDWASATSTFLKYGNANPLKDILREAHIKSRDSEIYKAKSIQSIGTKLAELGNALAVVRPQEAIEKANLTQKSLESAAEELNKVPQAYPFIHLLEKSQDYIKRFQLPEEHLFTPAGFKVQAAMIRYYLETEQHVQASTLAREAMVSKICMQETATEVLRYEGGRKSAEEKLNLWALPESANNKQIGSLWKNLRDLRNDINHAGMRLEALKSSKTIQQVQKYCEEVAEWISK